MTQGATGLVLRTYPLTETSLIIHWLTPDLGRLSTVAKGARRPKSPFQGKLDLFYLVDFSFSRSSRSDLHTLREVQLRDTRSALRLDLQRLQQASYAAALIEQATETETPLPGVFELMTGFLDCLCRQPPAARMVFAFELKFLELLGLQPDPEQTGLTAGARRIARALALDDWPAILRLKPTPAQNDELRRFLHGFLIYHLGRIPASRDGALAQDN